MRLFKLYFKLLLQYFMSLAEYKHDFILQLVGGVLGQVTGLVFIWVLFSNIADVTGWGLWEIILFYSIAVTSKALADIFLSGAWALTHNIRMGSLDVMLVRPLPPLFQVMSILTSSQGVGNFIMGIVLFILSNGKLNIPWTPGKVFFIIIAFISGAVIHASVNLAAASTSFWAKGITNNSFMFIVRYFCEFNKFPVDIYSSFMQFIVTWILPFAFVSFYPGTILLNRSAYGHIGYLTPLVAAACAAMAYLVWKKGLDTYNGVGS